MYECMHACMNVYVESELYALVFVQKDSGATTFIE